MNTPDDSPPGECTLSSLVLKRWRLATAPENLLAPDSEQRYNTAFWGSPADWDEIAPQQESVANLLFSPSLQTKSHESAHIPCVCIFADVLDGYIRLHRNLGLSDSSWQEDYEPWHKLDPITFSRNIDKIQDKRTNEEVYWCLNGEGRELRPVLEQEAKNARVTELDRFPDMDGVSVHVDLTMDELSVAYREEGGKTGLRIVRLPAWGLRAWLESIKGAAFLKEPESTKEMLIRNQGIALPTGGHLLPIDVDCAGYLKRLANMLPFNLELRVRFTGWLSSKAFLQAAQDSIGSRFANISFTHSYQTSPYHG